MKIALHKHVSAGVAAIALVLPALAQVAEPPAQTAAQGSGQGCSNLQVAIYFPAHATDLTPQSERVIDEASAQLKGCGVKAIRIDVLSEEAHTDEESAALSEARAASVMTALFENGIEPASYRADYSRVEAAAPGAMPMVEPMARRVSVNFELGPGFGA